MQLHDKTAYVRGHRYWWYPSLSRKPLPRFMPPWLTCLTAFDMPDNVCWLLTITKAFTHCINILKAFTKCKQLWKLFSSCQPQKQRLDDTSNAANASWFRFYWRKALNCRVRCAFRNFFSRIMSESNLIFPGRTVKYLLPHQRRRNIKNLQNCIAIYRAEEAENWAIFSNYLPALLAARSWLGGIYEIM